MAFLSRNALAGASGLYQLPIRYRTLHFPLRLWNGRAVERLPEADVIDHLGTHVLTRGHVEHMESRQVSLNTTWNLGAC